MANQATSRAAALPSYAPTGSSYVFDTRSSVYNFKTSNNGSASAAYKYATLSNTTVNIGSTVAISSPTATVQAAFIEIRKAAGGIAVHNLACSGSRITSDWDAISSGYSKLRQVTDTTAFPFTFDVVHIGFGLFDAVNPPASPTLFHDGLTTVCQAFSSADVILHAMPVPGQLRSSPDTWLQSLTEVYRVANELNLPVMDVQDVFGGYTAMAALGLNADTTAHYLPTAYQMWGRATTHLRS